MVDLSKIAALWSLSRPFAALAGVNQLLVPGSVPLICKGFFNCEQANSTEHTMYAVIESGGKQHRVVEGETLKLEKLKAPPVAPSNSTAC